MSLADRIRSASYPSPEITKEQVGGLKPDSFTPSFTPSVSEEDSSTRPEPPEASPKLPRDARGRLLPGHSLNPGGRPKGRVQLYREAADEADVIGLMKAVARGDEDVDGHRPTLSQRVDAAKWIEERAHGKATEKVINVDATPNGMVIDADTLDVEELGLFLKIARKQDRISEVIEGDFTPALLPGTDPKAEGDDNE